MRLSVVSGGPSWIEAAIMPAGKPPFQLAPLELPWPIQDVRIGDVDDDGHLDLLVTVWKRTRFHPQLAWRPFLYTLADDRWIPKWLGSRVGRELIEARLACPAPGPSKLVTLERGHDGARYLTIYHWRGFGFWGERTVPLPKNAAGLKIIPGDRSRDRIMVVAADGSPVQEYADIDHNTAGGGRQ